MEKYNNILNFYKDYIKLEQILRKGWIMCNVPAKRLESVADHTLQVLMLANIISKELDINIDNQKLTEMLLIHDIGEIIIGDVSEVEENSSIKKEKEFEAVKMLFSKLSSENEQHYLSLWLEMNNQNTPLSKFAYLLDKIDAVIKSGVYEEQYHLNGLFNEFFGLQKQKGTFKNTQLEDFFNFLENKFQKKQKNRA